MAILTKNEKYIVDMYVRYFGKAPSVAEIAKYNDFKTPKLILTEIRGDADDTKPLNTKEFVNNAFQNLFGRDANTKEMNKYSKVVDAGKDLPINAIVKSAKKADKGVYEAKKAIAIMLAEKENTTNYNLDKITKDTYADVYNLKTKKLLVDSVAQLETKIDAMPDNVSGTTFNLTTSADNFVGGEKGDVFNAYDVETFTGAKNTLTGIDTLNGGEGLDTLNVKSDIAIGDITATISGIETINLESSQAIDSEVSGSNITGLNTLNVTKATTAKVDAASTTDVNVSGATSTIDVSGGKNIVVTDTGTNNAIVIGQTATVTGVTATNAAGTITVTDTKQGTANITTNGGTDVTINATISSTANAAINGGDISVGATTAATGNVKITQNLNSDGGDADGDDLTAANIVVNGGKTVDITVNATVTAKNAAAEGDIAVGSIGVTGDGKTTDVTVTQNTTATTFVTAEVPEVMATQNVTFKALAAGENASIVHGGNTLTFTATKDLTAEQVAAAFADLANNDRQDNGGTVTNGTYTGIFPAAWATQSVNGATVTFVANAWSTSTLANTGSTLTALPTVAALVPGTNVTLEAETTNDITKGAVSVVDNAATDAIKTVTINGFNSALIGVDATNSPVSQLDALTTLTLSNNTKNDVIEVGTASKTLTLNVDNITSNGTTYINLDNDGNGAKDTNSKTIETLTINATGKDSSFELVAGALKDLTINATAGLDISDTSTSYATTALKTIDVNGAGKVNLGDISSATALNSFDASGNTGGVTATIETEIDSAILTGTITEYVFSAGNDDVTLSNDVIETKVTLGAGDDKITLASGTGIADVVATIDGGTGSNTIDMDAADAEILSSDDTFEGKISNFSKLSLGQVADDADNTINLANIDDISYVISAGTADTAEVTTVAITVGTAIVAGDTASITIDGTTYTTAALGAGDTATTIAAALDTAVGANYNVTNAAGTLTITSATGKMSNVGSVSITGTGTVTGLKTITSSELFLTSMANNGTLELTAAGMGATVTMKDASGNSDTFNIVIGDQAPSTNVGTVVVNSVETINVTTTDIFTDANENGLDDSNSSSTLVVSADAAKTVNVSGAGDLTLDTTSSVLTKVDASAMTGDLDYTADGATAGTEVIGGAGNDTLRASGEKDVLKGGAGNDTFYATDLTKVYGGAGADKFYFATPTQLSKVSTIADLGSGDTIYLVDNEDGDGAASIVGKFFAAGAQYNANTTTTFEAKVNASLVQTGSSEATWFQHAGNTYIVIDNDTDPVAGGDTDPIAGAVDTYTAGKDVVIEITGLVDLSKASFNATTGSLEIA